MYILFRTEELTVVPGSGIPRDALAVRGVLVRWSKSETSTRKGGGTEGRDLRILQSAGPEGSSERETL